MNECIVLKEVSDIKEIEILRNLRNECKDFMTRFTDEITSEQQVKWYNSIDKTKHKIYLLYNITHGVICDCIGYGYIRVEDNFVLLTGGLTKTQRGKGFGSTLFQYLVENSKQFNIPIKLEVLKKNIIAFSVYNKIGFRVVKDDGKVITMEYHYDSVI